MRRVGLALGFVLGALACGRAAVPEATIRLPPPERAAVGASQTNACILHGRGELPDGSDVDFDLFRTPSIVGPALRITAPAAVAVTWSELPPARSPSRARVEIGGQKLIRARAYADLVGRGFQLRRRGYQVADHVWIDGGVAVELLGTEADRLVVRRRTGFGEPIFFEARMACADLAYEPEPVDVPVEAEVATSETVRAPQGVLHLAAAPGTPSFLTITLGEGHSSFGVVERRGGSVRLSFAGDGVGFDGWVPANEVEVLHHGHGSMSGSGRCGGAFGSSRLVHVTTESAVLLGPRHEVLDDAVFEVDAELMVLGEADDAFEVAFPDGEITAPDGMWIAKSAVRP